MSNPRAINNAARAINSAVEEEVRVFVEKLDNDAFALLKEEMELELQLNDKRGNAS